MKKNKLNEDVRQKILKNPDLVLLDQEIFMSLISENNFSNDETIMIIRTFLSKTKRLYLIKKELEKGVNLESVIMNFRPPIFWKDKELVKQQIKLWSYENIQNLITEISDTEFNIKKNIANSLNVLQDFIYTQSEIVSN